VFISLSESVMSSLLFELQYARALAREAVALRGRFSSERKAQEFCDFEFSWEAARRRSRRSSHA